MMFYKNEKAIHKLASRPGFEPGLKALCAKVAPQASGMSTTPSGQNTSHGMLQVIKPVGLTYEFEPS
jgi:hypothetical protein